MGESVCRENESFQVQNGKNCERIGVECMTQHVRQCRVAHQILIKLFHFLEAIIGGEKTSEVFWERAEKHALFFGDSFCVVGFFEKLTISRYTPVQVVLIGENGKE